MSDIVSKTIFSGLGLASHVKDAVTKMAKDVAKSSNLSEAEGRRVVKHLKEQSTHLEKAVQKTVENAVHQVVGKLNMAAGTTHKSHKHSKPVHHTKKAKSAKA
jgi:polyhydroxyalkanoate synthesis regulator phasin